MKMMKHKQTDQRGVAAILTVLFFTILMSVITLSFMRVAVLEQTQTLQEQLSKSAYAAAQSGIEDAKRAVEYCQANPSDTACNHLSDTKCPGFFGDGSGHLLTGSSSLYSILGLQKVTGTNSIQVGDSSLNESYTCAVISKDTAGVRGQLNPENLVGSPSSDFMELKGTAQFTEARIYWDDTPADDGTFALPDQTVFGGGANARSVNAQWPGWPALMRLMVLQNRPTNGFDLSETKDGTQTRTYFVYPTSGGGSALQPFGSGATTDPHQTSASYCSVNGVIAADNTVWACKAVIDFDSSSDIARYLSLQAYYAQTDFVVELWNGATQISFNNIRPTIDATGAAGGVYRRVQATVQQGSSNNSLQPVALDLNKRLCKNFRVTNNPDDFLEHCTSE
jgi:Tfp pilus assembly protein PilX